MCCQFCGQHFLSRFVIAEAIFLALAQEGDVPILNPAYKALMALWLIVSLTVQTSANAHHTRLIYITERIEMWAVIHKSGARLPKLGKVIAVIDAVSFCS